MLKSKHKKFWQDDEDLRSVILLGSSGVGKSAFANNIINKLVMVKTLSNIVILESEGVDYGSISITKKPRLLKNDDLKAIICDGPGFNDSEGVLKEITNAYAIDKLFQNRSSPTKILLFINYHDIYGRRKQIEETIGQLERMFPNIDELKQCIGLVISMSENDRSTNDYLEFLQARSSPSLKSWCNFFIENNHRVFRFPTPERSENGNRFHDFPDRSNIIQFITDENFDIIHIDHQIGLSDSAKKNIRNFWISNWC